MRKELLRRFWRMVWRTPVQFGEHNCPIMAAGMSFFGIMSLVPLTLLGVSLLGYVLDSSEAQRFVSRLLLENFPASATGMLEQLNAIIAAPGRALINGVSAIGLMWSGMRFFNILQRVLNTIWIGATQRRFLRGKATAFAGFLVAGLLFWASFVFTSLAVTARELNISFGGAALNELNWFWRATELISTFTASVVMLFLVYLFVPHVKVSLKSASIGAVFAAILLQLSRWAFSFIMVRFDVYGRVYGPMASFIMFMSWLYLSMTILLLGAELGSQCQAVFFRSGADGSEVK